jgi:hypothetical protein
MLFKEISMTHNSTASATRKRTAGLGGMSAGTMPAQHCVGLVVASEDGGFTIASGSRRVSGRRAASCLLEPCVGDTVAGLMVAPDELWVVAVLQREEGVAHVLRCQGPARLQVDGGALTLAAQELAVAADSFSVRAATARFAVDDTQWIGQKLHFIGSTVKFVGAALSTVFERVAHFSKSHVRTTEGIDRVQATHIECEAEQLARISGQHLLLNGQDLVKARGGQIHFG